MTDRNAIHVPGTARTFDRRRILFVLLLAMAMSLMAVSSVNVALPTIEEGLGASPSDIQWVLSGYALALGVTLIPAGRAGDVLGRGSLFCVGMAVFVVASLACGLAGSPLALNAARLVQGLGAGLYSPQVTGMIQQYFSGGGRARAFALLGLVVAASVAVGPVLSGAIIEAVGPTSGWRWTFFTYLPVGLAGIVLAWRWFPFETERTRRATAGPDRRRVDLDPVGTTLATLTVLGLMYPFMARAAWAWLLLPLALGLGFGWTRWERRYAARGGEPLIDLDLFAYRSFRNGIAVSGAVFLGVTSTFVVVALFLQSGLGVGALAAGLIGLPNAILSGWAAIWTVRFVMEHGRRLVVVAISVMIGATLLSLVVGWLIGAAGISFWWLAAPLALIGLGMGTLGSANQTLSMQDIPPAHGGAASGLKQTVERTATAMGNAAITGVFFLTVGLADWADAFIAAFAAVTVCLTGALLLAVLDLRQHRATR
ncbi:MFS transporter [Propioniciclava soli]|uniref:MFS transporter n=1 Tax=Propioniciclava soli TaxID=2775081 RepID=A0ABZ3C9R0_9ACTN|nr:MFS transporter [Propioniciclava soli]